MSSEIRQWMVDFGLSHLLDLLEDNWNVQTSNDWVKRLSPGEKQTLAFIRLLYHCPLLAFLDEASSAISVEKEALLYNACITKGIQLISIGHRPTLSEFHHLKLTVGMTDGIWTIEKIK